MTYLLPWVFVYLIWYIINPFAARFWPAYFLHLAEQQYKVLFWRRPLTELLQENNFSQEEKEKAKLILEIKEFAEKLYGLKKTKTFSHYVDLKRKVLGYNITATPEFSLEPLTWQIPFFGKFSYLGFFKEELAQEYAQYLQSRGHDVYLSQISGYSTLGIFSDPVFNTYLAYSDKNLTRLVLHEVAHEKLYFFDDSSFSEALASFIEEEAYERWRQEKNPRGARVPPPKLWQKEYDAFLHLVEETKEKLSMLYQRSLAPEKKREQKKAFFDDFRRQLSQRSWRFFRLPLYLSSLGELNNATLVQYRRYNPRYESFRKLLEENAKQIPLWFEKLRTLVCPQARLAFLEEGIGVTEAAKLCK
ncbi:MAG: aminopeptidase [Leptospiraceae bacterium]|nr:aminopeptidase [Leptospiraceae bacterium]MDW8305583.1 aminopeptidase [Leptospiraceae bacterium]